MAGCRICAGELELKVAGNGAAVTAAALSPSAHAVGGHGDLLACRECGTVQQPILPKGAELHDLYREMRDDAYLAEEAGRRATANRLLDLIGAHVPRGRLLDVGCGHGLLLDEARRRGYDTVGLELSREAARHARETLGLDVREVPLEGFSEGRNGDSPGEFDAIVLADVLEHLDDPVDAIDRCVRLLQARRGAVRRHARPVVGDGAARGRALVGLPARAHGAAAAQDPARADLRRRARDLRRRPVRADVRRQALGRRAGRAARAGVGAADAAPRTGCRRSASASRSATSA